MWIDLLSTQNYAAAQLRPYLNLIMPYSTQEIEAMMKDGLEECQCLDGLSVPPVWAVKLDCRCIPCHRAANSASEKFFREHCGAQNVIQLQEHDHLKVVMKYYLDLRLAQDTQNDAIGVATAKREKEREKLVCLCDLRNQQQWERRS